MTIYLAAASANDKNASLVYNEKLRRYDTYIFKGNPVEEWNSPKLKWFTDSKKTKDTLVFNDFVPVFGAGMNIAINEKAKSILSETLADQVEFLSVDIMGENHNWYLINIINSIPNAINEGKSEFSVLKNGNIGVLKKAIFSEENIPDNSVFTFPESPRNIMTKGQFLENLIKENGLTGLEFRPHLPDTAPVVEAS